MEAKQIGKFPITQRSGKSTIVRWKSARTMKEYAGHLIATGRDDKENRIVYVRLFSGETIQIPSNLMVFPDESQYREEIRAMEEGITSKFMEGTEHKQYGRKETKYGF